MDAVLTRMSDSLMYNLQSTILDGRIYRAYRIDYGLKISFYGLNTTLVLSKIRSEYGLLFRKIRPFR